MVRRGRWEHAGTELVANISRLTRGLSLASITFVSPAFAQPRVTDERAADALFELAKQQLTRGDWQSACGNFRASMQLDPSVSTQIKIARCHEHEAQPVDAWLAYQRALTLSRTVSLPAARQQALQAVIQDALRELEPRLARLRLRVLPGSAAPIDVQVQGRPAALDPSDGSVVVEAGSVMLNVSAPGFVGLHLSVTARAGQWQPVEAKLVPIAPAVSAAAPPPAAGLTSTHPPTPDRPQPASKRPAVRGREQMDRAAEAHKAPQNAGDTRNQSAHPAAYWLGAGGVSMLAVAGYFGIRTLSLVSQSNAHCDPNHECDADGVDLIDRASATQKLGFVCAGVGAALLGTSVVLFSSSSRATGSPRRAGTSPHVAAGLGPAAITLVGGF